MGPPLLVDTLQVKAQQVDALLADALPIDRQTPTGSLIRPAR